MTTFIVQLLREVGCLNEACDVIMTSPVPNLGPYHSDPSEVFYLLQLTFISSTLTEKWVFQMAMSLKNPGSLTVNCTDITPCFFLSHYGTTA